jgi:uncharacterized protein YuzE
MRITYDPEADALQIVLRPDRQSEDGLDIDDGVTADLDHGGHIIGLEILDAGERIGSDPLARVSIERFPTAARSTKPERAKRAD